MKTDNPVYFFVAHVLTKYNCANSQFENFKKLVPTAAKTEMIRHSINPSYVTFVATFNESIDYKNVKGKLSYFYGGKSKILSIHHSSTDKPVYFYSTYLLQDFTPLQKHNAIPKQKHDIIRAVLALITSKPMMQANVYDCSVLIEIPDHDIRPEDIESLGCVLRDTPHHVFMASRGIK